MLLGFFAILAFVILAFVVVVTTVGITLASLTTLITAPSQLRALFRNRKLRRNHALEHATINVIEQRHGPTRLAGYALEDGFVIRGGATPDLIASAAREAGQRLRAGERSLAIHPRCGTTIVASQLVMGVIFISALIVTRQFGWLPFVLAFFGAWLLGPRLSPLLQRYVTTDPGIEDLQVVSVELQPPTGRLGMVSVLVLGPVLVRTTESASREPADSSKGGPVTVITGDRTEVVAGDYRVR